MLPPSGVTTAKVVHKFVIKPGETVTYQIENKSDHYAAFEVYQIYGDPVVRAAEVDDAQKDARIRGASLELD